MPFPDEPSSRAVSVLPYRQEWAAEGAALAAELARLVSGAACVDHIGSTSVPGLPAKDRIDVLIQVPDVDASGVGAVLEQRGYRRRLESWNQEEMSYGVWHPKQVYAPPGGARSGSVHVRQRGGLKVRYALLGTWDQARRVGVASAGRESLSRRVFRCGIRVSPGIGHPAPGSPMNPRIHRAAGR